jgi:hypothetical protein
MPDGQVRVDIVASSNIPAVTARDVAAIQQEVSALNAFREAVVVQPDWLPALEARMETSAARIESLANRIRQAGVGVNVSGLGNGGASVPQVEPPRYPPQYPAAAERIYDPAINLSALKAVGDEQQRLLDIQRQLGESASVYGNEQNAQLSTRLSVLAAQNAAMRRNAAEEDRANAQRTRFAQQIAPQMSVGVHQQQIRAEAAEEERAYQQRLRNVQSGLAAEERAHQERMRFLQQVPAITGGATPIRFEGVGDSLKALDANVQRSRSVFSMFASNSGRESRELGAIIDEIAAGSYRRLSSSLVVLLNYSGLLGQALRGIFTPIGFGIGAAVAGFAALAYSMEQTYQRFASIRDTAGNLGLQGLGNQTEAVSAQFDRIRSSTDEYAGTTRKLQAAISDLNPAARAVGESLVEQAKAIAALRGGDAVKIFDEMVKAANRGPEALAKLRVELLGLQEAVGKTGLSIEDQVGSTSGIASQYQVAAHAGEELRQSELKAGAAVATAKNEFLANAMALTTIGDVAGMSGAATEYFTNQMAMAIDPARALGKAVEDLTENERNQISAVQQGNSVFKERIDVLNQLLTAQSAIGKVPGAETAATEFGARLQTMPDTPGQAYQHKLNMEDIRAEGEARRANLQAQADRARQVEAETRRDVTQRFTTAGADPETASRLAEENEAVIKAHNDVLEADRRIADEQIAIAKIAIEARIAAEAQGSQQIVAMRRQLLELDQAQVALGRAPETATAQDKVRIETAERAHRDAMLQVTLRGLDAEQTKYRENAQRVAEIEADKARVIQQHAEESIRAGNPNLPAPQVRAEAAQRPDVAQEQVRLNEANDRAAKETLEIEIEKNRAIAAEDRRGGQERVAAQLEILQIMEANERLFGKARIEAQKGAVATTERQAQDQAFRQEREATQVAIADAKGHANAIDEIRQAYDKLRESAAATGQLPSVQLQINRDEQRDMIAQRNTAFSSLTESNSSQERLAQMRVATFKASEQEMVASHQISKEQMATQVEALQATEMAAQEARLQKELEVDGLTEQERQKLNDKLAELYTKDAQEHEQAQERITAAIQAENEKRIKSFANMFDTVGSGLEKFITEGITRSTTRAQALTELGRSLVSSVIKEVGSLASDYAGQKLGPMLGLTAEQSKGGLGEVLGSALAKQLGLLKDTPKDQQGAATALLQKATEAQEKATTSNTTALENLTKAIQGQRDLTHRVAQEKIGDAGSTGEYGVGQTMTAARHGGVSVAGQSPMSSDMFGWLKAHGYSDTAAAAVVGNSIQESSLNPNAKGGAGELGLFQELGPRRQALEDYASSQGTSPTDWKTQMEFMDQELQKLDPSFKKAGDSASVLAARFEKGFERPRSLADAGTRGRYAEDVLSNQQSRTSDQLPSYGGSDPTAVRAQQKVAQYDPAVPNAPIARAGPGVYAGARGDPAAVLDNGLPAIPPYIPRNSNGQPYTPTPAADQSAVDRSMAAMRDAQRTGKPWYLSHADDSKSSFGSSGEYGVGQDPARTTDAVAQGIVKGQQQAVPETQTAVQTGIASGTRDAAPALTDATKSGVQTGLGDLTAKDQQLVQATADQKTAVDKNTQQLAQSSQKGTGTATTGSTSAPSTTDSASSTTSQTSSNLGLLTQGLGIAATAASVFGRQLSTQARTVLGAVGLLTQLGSFAKNAGSALDLFGTTTKVTGTATTLMSTANTANTVATSANTLATTANSAAETTNSAASAAGGAASGVGGLFKAIPLIGSLFEEGGIVPAASAGMMVGTTVPSAAGGMIVPGSALGGGGQVSILHPHEMVLPANLSAGVQRMVNSGGPAANASIGDARPSFQTLPPPASVTHNSANANLTYAPQITGRFGSISQGEMSSILRTHGDMFDSFARNMVRNNGLFR